MFDPCVGVSDVCPHHPTALGLVVVQVVLSALLFVDGAVVEGVDEAVHAQASGLVVGGTAGRPKHHRVTTCQKRKNILTTFSAYVTELTLSTAKFSPVRMWRNLSYFLLQREVFKKK